VLSRVFRASARLRKKAVKPETGEPDTGHATHHNPTEYRVSRPKHTVYSYVVHMNAFLWTLQILLAAAFLIAGGLKILRTPEQNRSIMPWVDAFPVGAVKALGLAEVLGAIGLILPWALQIAKVLTPLAAVGLALIMLGAIVVHVRRKEPPIAQAVLFILAALIAFGRF
jgi:uncharacterized membrane protein